jgi:PAS domain S-box-containing protein
MINSLMNYFENNLSQSSCALLLESSNAGIIILHDLAVLDANRRAFAMFDCKREDLIGASLDSFLPACQPDGTNAAAIMAEFSGGEPRRFQCFYMRPNGTQFPAAVSLSFFHAGGDTLCIAAVHDITNERQVMQLSRNMYRINPIAMMLTDLKNGHIIDANDSFSDLFGFSYEESIGKTAMELGLWTNPDDRRRYLELSMQTGQLRDYEVLMRNKTGEQVSALINAKEFQYGDCKVLLSMAQDISKLRQAEISFRSIFDESPFGLLLSDPVTGSVMDANNRFLELSGHTKGEIIGRNATEYGGLPQVVAKQIGFLLQLSGKIDRLEAPFVRKNGEELTTLLSGRIIQFRERKATLVAFQDITLQKQVESALRKSEEKFSKFFSASPDFISVTDIETGCIIDANEGFIQALGLSREEIVGRTPLELGLWVDIDERQKFFENVNKNGDHIGFSTKLRVSGGNVLDVTISSRVIEIDGRRCLMNIVRDMSEKVRLEEQLRHAQRLEGIGRLAGGVAHDFNNILSGILGHVELALDMMDKGSQAARDLGIALDLVDKATHLSHSLLAFGRRQALNMETVNIAGVIRKSNEFLKRLIGEDIVFSMSLRDDATVNADILQIEQVITNMVVNARDAMPNGGKLCIKTDIVEIDEGMALRHQLAKTGPYVRITIRDTGVGMTKEIVDRIFDPFFTTKKVGKGTGLGLSMAYGIIRQHGGCITVGSKPDMGSRFKIFLPVVEGMSRQREKKQAAAVRGGKEIILIAEDDNIVRNLNRRLLEMSGYIVMDACDGEEALRVFGENADRIGLVVLDMIMPKKNGKEVFDAIKLAKPSMRFLFISGYTDDYVSRRTEIGNEVEIMLKPVSPQALKSKVREILDR